MVIKALSLWEPWASLMRCGAKTIETRSWYTAYRGPLLICAALQWTREQDEVLAWPSIQHAFRHAHANWIGPRYSVASMCLGKAVCIVDLQDCLHSELLRVDPAYEAEIAFGDFSDGRYGWVTNNRRVLDPFPVRGQQGLFEVNVPDSILEAV